MVYGCKMYARCSTVATLVIMGVIELSAFPGRDRGVEMLVSNRAARQLIVHRSPVWSDAICVRFHHPYASCAQQL